MNFVHQALTWGFLLALVPLLIHLINMMRHQRVKWAAMEFLLQSYKKHRKWVWLKQLFLLLARMAVVALVVTMLAQWKTRDQWLDLFGGQATHHFVLLDDSFSMSDRSGATTAFDTAKQVVSRIVARAAAPENFAQKLTLVRFSKATRATTGDAAQKVAQIADFNAEIVDTNFGTLLEEKRNLFEVTQLADGPRESLALVKQLLEKGSKDQNVVYVVSDFRANQWQTPAELKNSLRDLEKSGAEVHLVNCVKSAQPNLAVTDVRPTEGTRTAGVPLYVTVDVKNFGTTAAKKVQLKIRTIFYPPELTVDGDIDNAVGTSEELPTVLLQEIPPGETVQTRVQVYFSKPGHHAVEAVLPDDPITTDNRRWCVIDFPEGEPVLVIDGSANQTPSYYLTAVFQPGARANTGIRPTIQKPAFLRDISPQELASFRAIYLLEVDRLEARMVENLETFVKSGGGLAIFLGENVGLKNYTEQLYRGGEGLLPVPLERIDLLPPDEVDNVADIEVTDHPVFKVFLGEANSYIRLVTIEKYVRTSDHWLPRTENSTVRIAARLRNRQPLVAEKQFGRGRTIVFLTTLTPQWNNWAGDPSFIITQLSLQAHLGSTQRVDESRLVGTPLPLTLEANQYRPEIKFVSPGAKAATRVVIERTATLPKENSPVLQATLGAVGDGQEETFRSGLYEAWPTNVSGKLETKRFALNVETTEGDLAVLEPQDLLEKLSPTKLKLHDAETFESELGDQSGFNLSLLVLAVLVLLMLGEQLLAYKASYHPPSSLARTAKGVASR